jgi:MFS family permease
MKAPPDSLRATWAIPLLTASSLVLLALLKLGQDNNWDLRNYHLYTATAAMEGRLARDVAVAQLQTWHNPALDFPFAWMANHGLPGWLVSLWLALPAVLALALALVMMDRVWPQGRGVARTVAAGLAAVGGASMMPAIGSTMNDAFVAAGMMAPLWWIVDSHERRGVWATWVTAGLLAGLTAGLKLTGAIYCVGFVALALAAGPVRQAPLRLLALAMGGVAGGLVAIGPWAWWLWHEHGNPLFPYFNHWFQSPDAAPLAIRDDRFIPHGMDALLAPVHLLVRNQMFSELKLADPRLLLGMMALLLASIARGSRGNPLARQLLVFVLASYVAWLLLYGIYRYLVPIELVCSVAIIALLAAWMQGSRWRAAVLLLAALLLFGATKRPNWGRVPFSTPMVQVRFPALPAGSLVLLAGDQPLGYAVSRLPNEVAAVSLLNNFMNPRACTRLQAGVEARIRSHAGPLLLLRESSEAARSQQAWREYGLVQSTPCQPVASNLGGLELCPLQRGTPTATLCALPGP